MHSKFAQKHFQDRLVRDAYMVINENKNLLKFVKNYQDLLIENSNKFDALDEKYEKLNELLEEKEELIENLQCKIKEQKREIGNLHIEISSLDKHDIDLVLERESMTINLISNDDVNGPKCACSIL